jgi:hypothetical protein
MMSDDAGHTTEDGIERRRFLKGAATVAWATPLILTMTAHQAGAQAMSCLPNGGVCDACQGMPCCDADLPDDGGCCCSDALLTTECSGICVAVDADCYAMNELGGVTDFRCYVPIPPGFAAGRSAFRAGKPAKSL